ncbi:MAG: PilZ domain-containing protein [Nitrospirae bacterium]|nr:PilZ domain-containing protein [Nitrospirota bacterium]
MNKEDFVIGKPLPETICDKHGRMLLREGFIIKNSKQLKFVCELFDSVIEKQPDKKETLQEKAGDKDKKDNVLSNVRENMAQLDKVLRKFDDAGTSGNIIKSLETSISKISTNDCGFTGNIEDVARKIAETCTIDEDMALSCIVLQHNFNYALTHSMHVALMCEVVTRFLGWENTERFYTLCAALTMNISMFALQNKLQNKEGALTDDEVKTVRRHPQLGVLILKKLGVTNPIWLKSVLQHHESEDGSGYPGGLSGDTIGRQAKILKLADIYCARVSGRKYRKPLASDTAIQKIFKENDPTIDTKLAMALIKCIGLYLPGTFVRLSNGEIAIVTHRSSKIHQPIVHTVMDSSGLQIHVPKMRMTNCSPYEIAEVLPSHEYSYTMMEKLWQDCNRVKIYELKRKHERVRTCMEALISDADGQEALGTIINLSQSGCCIKIPNNTEMVPEINKVLLLSIPDAGDSLDKPIAAILRRVTNTNDYYYTGVEFMDLKPQQSRIVKCLLLNAVG